MRQVLTYSQTAKKLKFGDHILSGCVIKMIDDITVAVSDDVTYVDIVFADQKTVHLQGDDTVLVIE